MRGRKQVTCIPSLWARNDDSFSMASTWQRLVDRLMCTGWPCVVRVHDATLVQTMCRRDSKNSVWTHVCTCATRHWSGVMAGPGPESTQSFRAPGPFGTDPWSHLKVRPTAPARTQRPVRRFRPSWAQSTQTTGHWRQLVSDWIWRRANSWVLEACERAALVAK